MELLRRRAKLLSQIRSFMAERSIMEVETPVLRSFPASDPFIDPLSTICERQGVRTRLYLQSSPEAAMKCLLAAGSGPIYQLARVFRDRESGRLHAPEFSLLEWYRPGFDLRQLMDEVSELLQSLGLPAARACSYQDAFLQHLGLDPHTGSVREQWHAAQDLLPSSAAEWSSEQLLDLLLSRRVAPRLGRDGPQFLYDYPCSQAQQACIRDTDPPLADRFELYLNGIEMANGYRELRDAGEMELRFRQDLRRRRELGKEPLPLDTEWLAALRAGLPDCSGVALGVDRLLLVLGGAQRLSELSPLATDAAPRSRQNDH